MACPYFRPSKPLPLSSWKGKLRPPLGEPHAGECLACEAEAVAPGTDLLETCNLGYPALECARFPKSGVADAVRFVVAADEDDVVRIVYSYEKDHLPLRHGEIRYGRRRGEWKGLAAGSLLWSQAEAYLNSYLRWREGRLTRESAEKPPR